MMAFGGKDAAIVGLTLRQIFLEKRIILVSALLLIPAVIGIIWAVQAGEDEDVFAFTATVLFQLYLMFGVIIVALVNGTTLLNGELEDGTARYLVCKPVSRFRIVVMKYVGYSIATVVLVSIPMFVTSILLYAIADPSALGGDLVDIAQLVLACDIAGLVLGALFMLLGVLFKHPALIGLVFGFIWEVTISNFVGNVNRITLMFYVRSLASNWVSGNSVEFADSVSTPVAVAVLAIALTAFIVLSGWVFSRKDVN